MPQNFDLFGEPVPDGWGKPGRPVHLATQANANKVSMLVAFGWSNKRIARALFVTLPTLRKHYFSELKFREVARDRLDAGLAMKLWEQVQTGNVGAIKEFRRLQEHNDLMMYGQTTRPASSEPKPIKLGKKEQALVDAGLPDTGSTLGDLMHQRQSSDAALN